MRFQPKTDEEIQSMSLIPEGRYQFQVSDATNEISKTSGNEMIKLKLIVWDQEAHERIVFDYLLESMAHKLKHFCQAVGLIDDYESGILDNMKCIGKSGTLDLIIQKGKINPSGGVYPDKNVVKDYVVVDKVPEDAKTMKADPTVNDDLPF